MARIYLTLIGCLYLYLAGWCSVRPEETSQLVGFELIPGSGQSEFVTVYGGLEFALALIFLQPLWRPTQTHSSLWNCLTVHASLVAFRSVTFLMYENISPMTYKLATGEWFILLSTAFLVWKTRDTSNRVEQPA